jgi:hypothetical protein
MRCFTVRTTSRGCPGLRPRAGPKHTSDSPMTHLVRALYMEGLTDAPAIGVTPTLLWLWLWASPWPNGCLQQIAANRFSTPQDVIAILLQGFVRASLFAFQLRTTPRRAARCREWILSALSRRPIRCQGRSRDCATHPALEPLNDSRHPHRSRPRNSLQRDDAPPRPR